MPACRPRFPVYVLLAWCGCAIAQGKPVYTDPTAAIDARVNDLLTRMTLQEKLRQLEGVLQLPAGRPGARVYVANGKVDRSLVDETFGSGIGTVVLFDGFAGTAGPPAATAADRNALQHWVLKNTRLGIPILFHGEALHGAVTNGATSFPQAVALGSTWDPGLLRTLFDTVALESRAVGNALVLAPVLDLNRDPRYGRVQEMYSEDPYLVGRLSVAAIRGLQGDAAQIDLEHVAATAKHFVHGQPENGTNAGPSDFSERTMRDVFLRPFEQAVEVAHVAAVLPSYNENNGGIPSSADSWLLQQILRREWQFSGVTVSDYYAVEELFSLHHVAATPEAAGLLAFSAGIDMELPAAKDYPALAEAVNAGKLPAAQIDAAVARVLRLKFRLGLFEHPYSSTARAQRVVGSAAHAELARKAADEAIVLLQNRGNLLPLDPTRLHTIAVVGPNADKARLGTYSGVPPHFVTVLDGIRRRAGAATTVVYAEGVRLSEPDVSESANAFAVYQAPSAADDEKRIREAVDTARAADVVILVLGDNETLTRESFRATPGAPKARLGDTDSLDLPGRQNELVAELAKLGKPMVAILLNGRPLAVTALTAQVPAILEGWYLGQETGGAVADVVFGDVNPSGHLPVTLARDVGQLPVYYYKTPAARRGYVLDDNSPLFPFGFGLSYTTFTYDAPVLDRPRIGRWDMARVSVTVRNSGTRAGDDVVQLYVHHPVSSVVQPVRILRDFRRIHLDAGQSATVSFDAGPEALGILNAQMQRVVEPGAVDLLIGDNSADTAAVRLIVE